MKRRIRTTIAGAALAAALVVPAAPAFASTQAPAAPATQTASSAASNPLLSVCLDIQFLNINQCIVL